jgi:deazaflavin-dependent oxidoreductase (nitroreductase family)
MEIPDEQNCYLETTGRVTGRAHEIEIWYAARDSTLYLLSGDADRTDWVKNLKKEPRVRVRIADRTFTGSAVVIAGTDEDQIAHEIIAAKYYGWTSGPLPLDPTLDFLPVAIRLDVPSQA